METYGSETWVLTQENKQIIRVKERKALQLIYDRLMNHFNGDTGKTKNLFGEFDIIVLIRAARIRWITI